MGTAPQALKCPGPFFTHDPAGLQCTPVPADTESMKMLVLCADRDFQGLLEAALPHYELDFISEVSQLKDLDHMNCVFQHDSYDVLVLSDLGMPLNLAMRHVSLLPEVRTYGVLLLASAVTKTDKVLCSQRDVVAIDLPVKIPTLCDTIDRLGWPAHEYEPAPSPPRRAVTPSRSAKSRKRV
jgi:hypothetical protein